MSIEEFTNPITNLSNFKTATKLCHLSYFDALSVSCYLDPEYRFYRYIKVENIYIYFFILPKVNHLYIVFSSASSLSAIETYLSNEEVIDKVVTETLQVMDTVSEVLEVYCVGHSAGGAYAYYTANLINSKCVTIGQLPLYVSKKITFKDIDCAQFVKTSDLLCLHKTKYIVLLDNKPPKNTLEGVANNSINSYMKHANYLQDLKVEQDLTPPVVEFSICE